MLSRPPALLGVQGLVGVFFASIRVSHSLSAREEREKATMYGYAMLPNRRGSEHCRGLSGRRLVQRKP